MKTEIIPEQEEIKAENNPTSIPTTYFIKTENDTNMQDEQQIQISETVAETVVIKTEMEIEDTSINNEESERIKRRKLNEHESVQEASEQNSKCDLSEFEKKNFNSSNLLKARLKNAHEK